MRDAETEKRKTEMSEDVWRPGETSGDEKRHDQTCADERKQTEICGELNGDVWRTGCGLSNPGDWLRVPGDVMILPEVSRD